MFLNIKHIFLIWMLQNLHLHKMFNVCNKTKQNNLYFRKFNDVNMILNFQGVRNPRHHPPPPTPSFRSAHGTYVDSLLVNNQFNRNINIKEYWSLNI